MRQDGLEIVFDSNRAGGFDIYTSTRSTILEPWSRPRPLGPNVNSASDDETRASLSRDGKRLLMTREVQTDDGRGPALAVVQDWFAPFRK